MKNLINSANLRKALKPLLVLYFVISRNFIKWCMFKPLYRIECLLSCGKLHKPHWSVMLPEKLKWLSRLNYKLCKLSMFYGL
jgi:hypothetical protein